MPENAKKENEHKKKYYDYRSFEVKEKKELDFHIQIFKT